MNYDYTKSRTVRDTNKHIKIITSKQFREKLTKPTFPLHRFIKIDIYYYYSLLCGVFTITDLQLATFLGHSVAAVLQLQTCN